MFDILMFTMTGAIIYLFSDWVLRFIERRRGEPLRNRSVYFFIIFLVLALGSFELLQRSAHLFKETTPTDQQTSSAPSSPAIPHK